MQSISHFQLCLLLTLTTLIFQFFISLYLPFELQEGFLHYSLLSCLIGALILALNHKLHSMTAFKIYIVLLSISMILTPLMLQRHGTINVEHILLLVFSASGFILLSIALTLWNNGIVKKAHAKLS